MPAEQLQPEMVLKNRNGTGKISDVVRIWSDRRSDYVVAVWFAWHTLGSTHVEVLAYGEEVIAS